MYENHVWQYVKKVESHHDIIISYHNMISLYDVKNMVSYYDIDIWYINMIMNTIKIL